MSKEKLIIEQRLNEATAKKFFGMDGKFARIVYNLGEPIISHGGSSYECTELYDVYEEEKNEDELPEFDEDEMIFEVGYCFDALRFGVHLEILFNNEAKEIKVYYKGNLVYKEISGELECYVPSNEWENHIEYFYKMAKVREEAKKKKAIEINKEEIKQYKLSLLQRLKQYWGI